MSQSSSYFIRIRGKIMGPFGESQLVSLKDRGQLKPFHEVSSDRVLWAPASTLLNIFSTPAQVEAVAQPQPNSQTQSNNQPSVPNSASIGEQWYYSDDNGNRFGPIDSHSLKATVDSGQILFETMVWKAGMSDWAPANSVLPGLFGPKLSVRKNSKESKKNEKLLEDLRKTRLGILLILIAGLVALFFFPLVPVAFILGLIGLGLCMSAPAPAKGPATLAFYFSMGTALLWTVWFISSIFGWHLLFDFFTGIWSGALFADNREAFQAAEASALAASLTFLGFLILSFMIAIGMLFACGAFLQNTLKKLAIVTGDQAIVKLANINFIFYATLSGMFVTLVYLFILIPFLVINKIFILSPTMIPKVITVIFILQSFLFLAIAVCYIITLVLMMQLYGKIGKMVSAEEE